MSIYRFSAQVIKRSTGKSAVAAAAYRSGQKIKDHRQNKTFDYTRKTKVSAKVILAPPEVPSWVKDRAHLWNEVEAAEKRKDAQLAREVLISLPVELDANQMQRLVANFIKEQFVAKGMIADIAIHGIGTKNPHTHVMLTTREITPDGFGKKNRDWNKVELLEKWREAWAEYANRYLDERSKIDHRSNKAQGLDRKPINHSMAVWQMQARGLNPLLWNPSGKVIELIAVEHDKEKELEEIEAEIRAKANLLKQRYRSVIERQQVRREHNLLAAKAEKVEAELTELRAMRESEISIMQFSTMLKNAAAGVSLPDPVKVRQNEGTPNRNGLYLDEDDFLSSR